MGLEYELKFSADPAVQDKIRLWLGGGWFEYRMHTTYYDAADGGLSARKWTLRHRLENSIHVCTLKTPAGDARGEWEVECDRIEDAIEKLCKLGAPSELAALTRTGIQAVCGARFTRLAATVEAEDAVLEVALDSGVLFAGQRQEPLCEVEVELKSGDRASADRFAQELAQAYGLQILHASKFKRALALREEL